MEDDDSVVGTIGVELLKFHYGGQEIVAGVGSNFHALRSGVGGYLFLQWVKACPFSLEFGGSEDAHKIISHQRWSYFKGIKTFVLNYDYPAYPGNRWFHKGAKWALRNVRRKTIPQYTSRIPREVLTNVAVHEEYNYTQDLLPRRSPFVFRIAASIDFLAWRYNLTLSFVRYRLFRVLSGSDTLGYVVLSDFPDRIIVAHCDGDDPCALAYGALLSVLEVARLDRNPRMVLLNCSHTQMQLVYEQFGFRPERNDFLFALGSLRQKVDIPPDTSKWLINYDWCDHGLLESSALKIWAP